MAQVKATPGDRRHGFSYIKTFSYPDVGRISALAVTEIGNIIVCDNLRNKLVLFDQDGNYLNCLQVDGGPRDIAINKDNLAFITVPNKSKVLVVDPDICCCRLFKEMEIGNNTSDVIGVSSITNSSEVMMFDFTGIFKVTNNVCPYNYTWSLPGDGNHNRLYSSEYDSYVCKGQDSIYIIRPQHLWEPVNVKIPTLTVPSDICADDYGHIYVSGQYSHNIHRLTKDGKVIDIPLHSQHGIKHPVATCFNQTCTKFYIANEFGANIQIYDVV